MLEHYRYASGLVAGMPKIENHRKIEIIIIEHNGKPRLVDIILQEHLVDINLIALV